MSLAKQDLGLAGFVLSGREDLPSEPGFYALRHGGYILYIGESSNLRKRLKLGSHVAYRKACKVVSSEDVEIWIRPSSEYCSDMKFEEAALIGRFRPIGQFGVLGDLANAAAKFDAAPPEALFISVRAYLSLKNSSEFETDTKDCVTWLLQAMLESAESRCKPAADPA